MLIIIHETTMLNIERINSLMIKNTPVKKKSVVDTGFLGLFPKYEEVDSPCWTLEFSYTKPNDPQGSTWTFTCKSEDYNSLKKDCQDIIKQIKSFDASMISAAFEAAFLKE